MASRKFKNEAPFRGRDALSNQLAVENMIEGMLVQDSNGAVVEYNSAALEVLGLSSEQLLKRDSMDPRWQAKYPDGSLLPGPDHPPMVALNQNKVVSNFVMGVEAPDKGLRWLLVNSVPFEEGGQRFVVTTFLDITDQHNKKLELNAYAEALDRHAIIARTDKWGKITYANKNFCKISGYSLEELIGNNHRIINSGHHPKEFFKDLWMTISTGRSWRGRIKNRAKNGDFYWVDTIISPVTNANGDVVEFVAFRYDVTSQITNEEELIRTVYERNVSLNFLESIQDNAAHAIISGDNDGVITSFNKKAEEMLGYSSEEIVGKKILSCLHDTNELSKRSQEFTEKLDEEILPGFETLVCHSRLGLKNEFEWTFVHKNGSRFPVLLTITELKDSDGVVNGYLGLAQDLTSQKRLEKKLIESKNFLELALEGAGLGIWDWNLETNEVTFDNRWADMLGLDIEKVEMNFNTWESRVHPEDIDQFYANITKYIEGKVNHYESTHRMRHADGHWVYVLDRGRFSDWDGDGKPIRFTGTHLDITLSKKAQEEKVAELNNLLSATPSCLKVINKKGELLDMNTQGLGLIEANDLDSVYMANVYDIVEESHRDKFIAFNERVCSGEKGSLKFEIIGLLGTRRWMETYAAPFPLSNGELGHIAITNDITHKIKSEREIETQKAIAQHHARLASIGELAAGVGHEINNPLAIVKGYAQTIRKRSKHPNGLLLEDLETYLDKIDLAVDRVARIVQGLRTFSRSNLGEASNFSPVNAIKESLGMIQEIYRNDGIQIKFTNSISDDDLAIRGEQGKFQQIFMNLLTNAKDAFEGRENKIVRILLNVTSDIFELHVQDNGCGIPNEIKEKIFDPFFTTKDVDKGTGIGLSLVHNFIKEMGGKLDVTSEKDKGTTFILKFPKSTSTSNISELTPKQDRTYFNIKALLADDEEDIRELLAEILEGLGVDVTCVENGKEAYSAYCESPNSYDLIVSDMKMPVMDGVRLLKTIRKDKKLKQPKFIFVTGGINVDFENEQDEISQLSDGYFLKPFDEESVIDALSKCFDLDRKIKRSA